MAECQSRKEEKCEAHQIKRCLCEIARAFDAELVKFLRDCGVEVDVETRTGQSEVVQAAVEQPTVQTQTAPVVCPQPVPVEKSFVQTTPDHTEVKSATQTLPGAEIGPIAEHSTTQTSPIMHSQTQQTNPVVTATDPKSNSEPRDTPAVDQPLCETATMEPTEVKPTVLHTEMLPQQEDVTSSIIEPPANQSSLVSLHQPLKNEGVKELALSLQDLAKQIIRLMDPSSQQSVSPI